MNSKQPNRVRTAFSGPIQWFSCSFSLFIRHNLPLFTNDASICQEFDRDSRRHALIRPANRDDVDRLAAIARAAYLIYVSRIGKEPAPMVADFAALIAEGKVWVVGDTAVDGFIVMFEQNDALQVDNVAVDPSQHGNGFGGQLLDFAEAEARKRQISKITLYTNVLMSENLSFYPSLGYREIGRRKEDGFDRVYFSKSLFQRA